LATGPPCRLDYDPTDELQGSVAAFCERLAQLEADSEGISHASPEAVQRVLETVSVTPAGTHLSGLRNASRAWLETTLETCRRFERENYNHEAVD
jgi:hypothetical protein